MLSGRLLLALRWFSCQNSASSQPIFESSLVLSSAALSTRFSLPFCFPEISLQLATSILLDSNGLQRSGDFSMSGANFPERTNFDENRFWRLIQANTLNRRHLLERLSKAIGQPYVRGLSEDSRATNFEEFRALSFAAIFEILSWWLNSNDF